jgi:hypothetical protein
MVETEESIIATMTPLTTLIDAVVKTGVVRMFPAGIKELREHLLRIAPEDWVSKRLQCRQECRQLWIGPCGRIDEVRGRPILGRDRSYVASRSAGPQVAQRIDQED